MASVARIVGRGASRYHITGRIVLDYIGLVIIWFLNITLIAGNKTRRRRLQIKAQTLFSKTPWKFWTILTRFCLNVSLFSFFTFFPVRLNLQNVTKNSMKYSVYFNPNILPRQLMLLTVQ